MQTKYLERFSLGIAVLLCLSGCATPSKSKVPQASNAASSLPENADDFVLMSEVDDANGALFQKHDIDSDGMLSPKEAAKLPSWAATAKKLPNGNLSVVGLIEAGQERFKKFAKKNPKELTAAEFKAMEASK